MAHATEREKMLNGLYLIDDPELVAMRHQCYTCSMRSTLPAMRIRRSERSSSTSCSAHAASASNVKSTFRCDYGSNIFLGDDVFINVECVICDCAPVRIGDGTLIGPQVGIYAVTHPLDAVERSEGREWASRSPLAKTAGSAGTPPSIQASRLATTWSWHRGRSRITCRAMCSSPSFPPASFANCKATALAGARKNRHIWKQPASAHRPKRKPVSTETAYPSRDDKRRHTDNHPETYALPPQTRTTKHQLKTVYKAF